jgi:geranylgeranyl pyrophosphate synthase
VDRIRNLILPSSSIEYARERARELVDKARGALAELPDTEARRMLDTMAAFVVTRPL